MIMSDGQPLKRVLEDLMRGREWFTKDFKQAIEVEKLILRTGYGYIKTVDNSWGFQATFKLGPEESKYWR